jgi:hypothetical protein
MTKIVTAMATLLLTCHQTRRAYLDGHIDAYIGNMSTMWTNIF